jgi:hypothetical protein
LRYSRNHWKFRQVVDHSNCLEEENAFMCPQAFGLTDCAPGLFADDSLEASRMVGVIVIDDARLGAVEYSLCLYR